MAASRIEFCVKLFVVYCMINSGSVGQIIKRLPPYSVGEVGSDVSFNFSAHKNADFYKRSEDCLHKESMFWNGKCTRRINCTSQNTTNYSLQMLNVTPSDAGTYIAKDDDDLPGRDNCSTELVVYSKRGLGDDSLLYAIWGHNQNVTIVCAGTMGTVVNKAVNNVELAVQVPLDSLVNCTLTVYVPSICGSNEFQYAWFDLVNTSCYLSSENRTLHSTGTTTPNPGYLSSENRTLHSTGTTAPNPDDASTAFPTKSPDEPLSQGQIVGSVVGVMLIVALAVVVYLCVAYWKNIFPFQSRSCESGREGTASDSPEERKNLT